MKTSLALFCGGALALAGSFLWTALSSGSPNAAAPSGAEIEARLEHLARENEELRTRLAGLERRPAPAIQAPVQRLPDLGGLVAAEEFAAFREEVRRALGGTASGTVDPETGAVAAPNTEFRETVAEALSEIRKDETVVKIRDYQEGRLAKLDETMPRIQEWLELTPQQTNELRGIVLSHYGREAALLERWENGEDEELIGEQKELDRETYRTELGWVLSPEQLETFWSRAAPK